MMKTLLIEDNPQEGQLFEEQLRLLGHNVTSCLQACDALNALKKSVYPLIILDLGLPDMDGLDLCRRIRALPQSHLCMILVITGRDEPEDLQAALDAGADDYLIKPFSLELFKMRLKIFERQLQHLIRRNQAEKALNQSFSRIEQAKQEWESTVDSLSEVICVLERGGCVLYANKTLEHWNLGTVTEVKGQNFHDLFHPTCDDAACYLKEFLSKARGEISRGRTAECQVNDILLDRYLSIHVRPITAQQKLYPQKTGSFSVAIVKDVTERKQTEQLLRRQDELLRGVSKATNCLLVMPGFQQSLTQAMKILGLATNVDRVYIIKTYTNTKTGEPSGRRLLEWRLDPSRAHTKDHRFASPHFKRWYDALTTNKFIHGFVRNLPLAEQELFTSQQTVSYLMLPITIDDQFWGFLGFDNYHAERHWREEERTILSAIAGSIGGAIAHEQTERKLRQTNSELLTERTAELTAANKQLRKEITKRRLAESALRELNQHLQLLADKRPEQQEDSTFPEAIDSVISQTPEPDLLQEGVPAKSILVVEDDEMSRNLVGDIFTKAGYTVYKALSGEESLSLAVKYVPDIVFMNLVMEGMDGFETTQRLKQYAMTKDIPVVACSAVTTDEFKTKAIEVGCAGYITKPIEPDRLVEQVMLNTRQREETVCKS